MTSQINNIATIDSAYPVAGQDNDSQGFRDNFTAINSKFSVADSEVTTLQTNAVLKAALGSNDPVENDLGGLSVIKNGLYKDFHGVVYNPPTIVSQADIDVTYGPLQSFTAGASVVLRFTGWPANNQYGCVRVHLKSDSSTGRTITLATSNGGTIYRQNGFPSPLVVTNTSETVIEAWTYSGSAKVFVRYLGTYSN